MLILRRLYSRQSYLVRKIQPVKRDPGISKQKKIITETQDVSENDFEEIESDFMNVHKTHREHVEQMKAWKEKEKLLIVKQKYFKEKYPNFLTWHDKEQIQYLYNHDPEEWSIEKLSEGFPALPDVIQKIVKNKWVKKNQAKISAHDKLVKKHWIDFKKGKHNQLPEELKEHLQKFSNRSLNLEPFKSLDSTKESIQNKGDYKRSGEFSEIIESYQRLKSKNQTEQNSNLTNQNRDLDLTVKNPIQKKHQALFTFKELKDKLEENISRGKHISEEEQLILQETKPTKEDINTTIVLKPEDISKIVEHRHETNSSKVGFVRKTTRDMSHLVYPEKIIIPQDQFKKGYTYKLNDCYYDSDGEFLYRIPGMT